MSSGQYQMSGLMVGIMRRIADSSGKVAGTDKGRLIKRAEGGQTKDRRA